MDTIQFDLVTPETTFFSGNATQIDIPGTLGDFGVLPNHSALISTLRTGVIKIYTDKGTKRAFVASGIAEVNPSSCTVLAERVIDLDTMTRPEAEKMLLNARNRLEKAVEESEKSEAIREVEISEALTASL